MAKCPFCGSPETRVETPFLDLKTGKTELAYCCGASKKNAQFIARRFDQSDPDNIPTLEEVSKL